MSQPKHDNVNHPPHYTSHPSGFECIDLAELLPFTLGNALKYFWRAGLKDGGVKKSEDLKKGFWYVKRYLDTPLLTPRFDRNDRIATWRFRYRAGVVIGAEPKGLAARFLRALLDEPLPGEKGEDLEEFYERLACGGPLCAGCIDGGKPLNPQPRDATCARCGAGGIMYSGASPSPEPEAPRAKRFDVHSGPHTECQRPDVCDCECKTCKDAWFKAKRPRPNGA